MSATMSSAPSFLSAFGFTAEKEVEFAALLADVDGFIAGGSALSWYLGDASPAGQDLDIWIRSHTLWNHELQDEMEKQRVDPRYSSCRLGQLLVDDYKHQFDRTEADREHIRRMYEFLGSLNYRDDITPERRHTWDRSAELPYHTHPRFKNTVLKIYNLYDSSRNRKIQMIMYYGNVDPLGSFDLDLCCTAARPAEGGFRLELPPGVDEAQIRARHMRIIDLAHNVPDLPRRIQKYYSRGFRLVNAEGGELSLEDALKLSIPFTV